MYNGDVFVLISNYLLFVSEQNMYVYVNDPQDILVAWQFCVLHTICYWLTYRKAVTPPFCYLPLWEWPSNF